MKLTLTVNGAEQTVEASPNETLIQVLRERLELTGTKEGCGTGDCGACTVLVDGKAVNSCLMLAAEAEGRDVLTIEGLAKGNILDPIQTAYKKYFALQCGYCTPGFVMATKALLDENPSPTDDEIKRALHGNICRCTGYTKIMEAVASMRQEK